MRQTMAGWLRRLAQWLDPVDAVSAPRFPAELLEGVRALVQHADTFAAGTSGEYRRSWALGKTMKRFPDVPKGTIAFAIEVACFERGRR